MSIPPLPPLPPQGSQPPDDKGVSSDTSKYKELTKDDKNVGGDHLVMGMHMNDQQYKAWRDGLMKNLNDQISQDKDSWDRTQNEIKQMEQEDEG